MKKGDSKLLIRNLRKMKEQEKEKQALDLSNVRHLRFQEVWQKWCELDEEEFDKWLHDQMHNA